ncbi:DDE-type integrase/transposase/recombinase [Streptomyces sp. GESEQ-4]|uniref:DDE-type integrase/transposase/recombinase n=1 Tax=Streptomyces sp. GESEQ-4 TaxID=2812655 RepID=UPI001B33FD4E|nr:DDE-type integrase/transposase/recombinase [Streptomyces sp. GESEQ-4]
MNRFQFVADHQRRFGVKRLCTILGIARSSFYYWRRTAAARAVRQAADAQLSARIRKVHQGSDGTYGVPRITAERREEGQGSITSASPASYSRSAWPDCGCDADIAPPSRIHITYLPLAGGKFLHLATVIDLASRRLAGWAIDDHMRAELVIDALAAAKRCRSSLAGPSCHRPRLSVHEPGLR